MRILFAALLMMMAAPAAAQTPADAYAQGCGPCHASERRVLRSIPKLADDQRRAWLVDFVAHHPCERHALKPAIIEYLMARTAR